MSEVAAPAAPQRLDRHRVYILPNGRGVTFGAMVLVILIGAINYDNALGYLLAFLLFGLLLVAMLHTYRNLVGLAYHGARATAVFVGAEAVFACHFDTPVQLPRLALKIGPWPAGMTRDVRRRQADAQVDFDLPAAGLMQVQLRCVASRRGWLPLGRLRVHSVYPLGLLRAWAYFDAAASCLVYPAPHGHLPLPYVASSATGNAAHHDLGSDEFAGLRPYVPGDPVRAIAWKTLARERGLMIKRFHGQGTTRIVLSWSALTGLADVEARLAQLCRWVLDANAAGFHYALEVPGLRRDFGHGHDHRDACLRALALFDGPP